MQIAVTSKLSHSQKAWEHITDYTYISVHWNMHLIHYYKSDLLALQSSPEYIWLQWGLIYNLSSPAF